MFRISLNGFIIHGIARLDWVILCIIICYDVQTSKPPEYKPTISNLMIRKHVVQDKELGYKCSESTLIL